MSLVLDLRVAHNRVDSSPDPSLNGHLRYPNNLDQSLNDTSVNKIHRYRTDYNNNPPRGVDFMPAIASTSGRLHSEFIRILSLQDHRETNRFFLKFQEFSRHNQILDSSTTTVRLFLLCSNLGLEKLLVYEPRLVFRCSSSTTNSVSTRRVDSSFLVFSLSSHRYSYISLLFSSRFIDS